jgi:hypothetical protein
MKSLDAHQGDLYDGDSQRVFWLRTPFLEPHRPKEARAPAERDPLVIVASVI